MQNITLLLTIYNRRKFTLRWLRFYFEFNCPFKLYICDGGNDKFLQKKLKKLANENKKITYKKVKYYRNYKNFYEKFYLATKSIKTKYTYLCEDDDFIIFENIKKSKEFLDKNLSYHSSGGIPLNLEVVSNNLLLSRLEHSQTLSFSENKVFHRLKNMISNMQSNYNCLHRTRNLNLIFKKLFELDFKNFHETELFFVLYSVYFGKVNRFNHIEYIKVDNTKFSSSNNFLLNRNYFDILSSNKFTYENYSIMKIIEKKLNYHELKEIERQLNIFLSGILRERIIKILNNNRFSIRYTVKHFVKSIFKYLGIISIIKKLISIIFFSALIPLKIYSKDKASYNLMKKNFKFFKTLHYFLSNNKIKI